jgi:hypothetical protein
MLFKRHCAVGAYGIDVIGVENRQTIGFHLGGKIFTVVYKKLVVYWKIFHVLKFYQKYKFRVL